MHPTVYFPSETAQQRPLAWAPQPGGARRSQSRPPPSHSVFLARLTGRAIIFVMPPAFAVVADNPQCQASAASFYNVLIAFCGWRSTRLVAPTPPPSCTRAPSSWARPPAARTTPHGRALHSRQATHSVLSLGCHSVAWRPIPYAFLGEYAHTTVLVKGRKQCVTAATADPQRRLPSSMATQATPYNHGASLARLAASPVPGATPPKP